MYIDETGIDTFLYREYGYALRGQRVYSHISGNKYKRVGIVAPLEYEGTMDSTLFEKWFAQCKLVFLPPYSPELNPIENFWSWLKR